MNRIRCDPSFLSLNSLLKWLTSCTSLYDLDDCVSAAVSDPDLSVSDFLLFMSVYQNSILEV